MVSGDLRIKKEEHLTHDFMVSMTKRAACIANHG